VAVDVDSVLWDVAVARAAEHGYELSPDVETFLREFVRDGARTMVAEGVVDEGPRMDEAVEHLEEFVDGMAVEVVAQGFTEFHEPTFFAARVTFCEKRPNFWPFCKRPTD
jgi:hypothetical protein